MVDRFVTNPKINKDTGGVGILEVVWKAVGAVIDTRIKTVVQFFYILHEFQAGRGAGTSIMNLKLTQELESVEQYPLSMVFLDLRKALQPGP